MMIYCCQELSVFVGFFLNFRILFIFLYSRFLLVIHFIHISVYVSIPIYLFMEGVIVQLQSLN